MQERTQANLDHKWHTSGCQAQRPEQLKLPIIRSTAHDQNVAQRRHRWHLQTPFPTIPCPSPPLSHIRLQIDNGTREPTG